MQLPPCPSVFSNRFLSWVGGWGWLWISWQSGSHQPKAVLQRWGQPESEAVNTASSRRKVLWPVGESWMGCQSTQCRMHHSYLMYLTSASDVLDPDYTDTGLHHQGSKKFFLYPWKKCSTYLIIECILLCCTCRDFLIIYYHFQIYVSLAASKTKLKMHEYFLSHAGYLVSWKEVRKFM